MDAAIQLSAAGLLLAGLRAAAVLLTAPLLAGRPLPVAVALPTAAALALALFAGAPLAGDLPAHDLPFLAAREAAAGAALGLCARIAFSVFESAGRLVDAAAAPGAARAADADGPIASLYAATGLGAFLLVGGHRALVAALRGSFATCPLGGDALAGALPAGGDAAAALFAGAFAGAVLIAAPAFAAGLVADAAAGLAGRLFPTAGVGSGAAALRAVIAQAMGVAILAGAVRVGVELITDGLGRAGGFS